MTFKQQMKLLRTQQAAEQAWSAAQAEKQMQFQHFESSTAHQREVQDLQAAGLNPVLSAGGNGATSGSGAMADAVSIIPQMMQAMASAVSHAHGGGTKVEVNTGKETGTYVDPEGRPFVTREVDPSGKYHLREDDDGSRAFDKAAYGGVKRMVNKLKSDAGELRASVGASGRSGVRGSVSGTLSQVGKIIEDGYGLYRASEGALHYQVGKVLKNLKSNARELYSASSAKAQSSARQKILDNIEKAQNLSMYY